MSRLNRSRRRWRRTGCLLVVLLLAAIGTPLVAGLVTMAGLLYPPCHDSGATPSDVGLTWEDLRLTTDDGHSIRAYFIPGTNGAAVIIPPPYSSGRGSRLEEAAVLARHGYAVLTFESRRCADMGPLTLGYKETAEIGLALETLSRREGVQPDRIAVLGFSSAGAASVMAAARYPALRAVIAEGGYGDLAEGAVGMGSGSLLERLYKWSLAASYRLITGVDLDRLSPIDALPSVRPRPILLIYGSTERSLEGARRQQRAAGDSAELWIVEGAGHGNYLAVAPQEYEARVIAFLDKALPAGQE